MTTFLRLLADKDKADALISSTMRVRSGDADAKVFKVDPKLFSVIPGAPFSYWVPDSVRDKFQEFPAYRSGSRQAVVGLQTSDNFRFLRLWFECLQTQDRDNWKPYAKGGDFSRFYAVLPLVLWWEGGGREIDSCDGSVIRNEGFYFRPGLTWSTRTTSGLSVRALPSGCSFDTKGCSAFVDCDSDEELLLLLALMNSDAFAILLSLQLAAADAAARSYDTGIINQTPVVYPDEKQKDILVKLSKTAWSLKRRLDTVEETSHAFVLPATLRSRLGDYHPKTIALELVQIQSEIDTIAFNLYGFSEDDHAAMQNSAGAGSEDGAKDDNDQNDHDSDDENGSAPIDDAAGLLSWAVGVAFGRYDWRLATAEREVPEEPEPFDPLLTKSPGMLPDDAEPFHAHTGILVDDEGHSHDLAYLLEEVLQRVDAPVQVDTRRWLQREFFPFHLQRYSKSRRKAPIYWPLSTLSGAYTLWLYYPDLTSQTLFSAVNDFIEPKLKQVRGDLDALRGKGNARSKQEEKQLEIATDLAQELADLRDALMAIAPKYSPNHDDGVQITAAPLWPLFRHKPWQKVLKDTWEKLEAGEYDWAHLAYSYWPDRVREKCKTDKSLAIAHGLEEIYEEPAA